MNFVKGRSFERSLAYCLATSLFLVLSLACSQQNDSDSQQTTPVPAEKPRDSLVVEIIPADSIDVLSALQMDHVVDAKSSAMGAFVISIDSVAGGGTSYWLYSVNGEMAQEACDQMIVGAGDTVRWHFRCTGN